MDYSAAVRIATVFVLICTSHLYAQRDAGSPPHRNLAEIEFEGLETIPESVIRRRLATQLDVVEAQHPSIDESTFNYRVQDAVERGLRASGFLDSRVVSKSPVDGGRLRLKVFEGPRFSRGEIVVIGGDDGVNGWVRSCLEKLKSKDRPVWNREKPANGNLFSRLRIETAFKNELTQRGLKGADSRIEFVRDETDRSIQVHVHLADSDATFVVPSVTALDAEVETGSDSLGTEPPNDVRAELEEIYERNFSTPSTGLIVRTENDDLLSELAFSDNHVIAQWESKGRSRTVVISDEMVVCSVDKPPAAIRVPASGLTIKATQQTTQESKKGGNFKLEINGAFRFGKNASDEGESNVNGFVFTPDAWKAWFPPDSTTMVKTDTGRRYENTRGYLIVDHNGDLVRLSGRSEKDGQLNVTSASNDDIKRRATALIDDADAEKLFVRDPVSGQAMSLGDLAEQVMQNRSDDHDFRIPVSNGQMDLWGTALLFVANDERFVEHDSVLARLMTLVSLDLGHRRRGIAQRMKELEPEALAGPVTALVLGSVAIRTGHLDQAIRYHEHALRLAQDDVAVQRDLDLLFDESSLVGRLCEGVDIKSILELGLGFAAHAETKPGHDRLVELVRQMPDAQSAEVRRENARRFARVWYELSCEQRVEEYCDSTIASLQSRKERLAKKQKEKRDAKRERSKSRLQ